MAKVASIVWFARTLVKVYEVTAPTELPSTWTSATWWLALAEMVKLWPTVAFTVTAPDGVMLPLAPADAVIVYVSIAKLAEMVWFASTLLKVYEVTAPTELPSTRTSATWWLALAEMVKL